jgi:hypothetical protein
MQVDTYISIPEDFFDICTCQSSDDELLIADILEYINSNDNISNFRNLVTILKNHSKSENRVFNLDNPISLKKFSRNLKIINSNEKIRNYFRAEDIFPLLDLKNEYLIINGMDHQLSYLNQQNPAGEKIIPRIFSKLMDLDEKNIPDGSTHLFFLYFRMFERCSGIVKFFKIISSTKWNITSDYFDEFEKIKKYTKLPDEEIKKIFATKYSNDVKNRTIEFVEGYCKEELNYLHVNDGEKFLTISPKKFFYCLKIIYDLDKEHFREIVSNLYNSKIFGCLYCTRVKDVRIQKMKDQIYRDKNKFMDDLENFVNDLTPDEDFSQMVFLLTHTFDMVNLN